VAVWGDDVNLTPVAAHELYAAWPIIRIGCQQVIEKTRDRILPDDIYVELKSLTAFLYRIELAGDEVGFLVVRRVMDPDGPALFVWFMYSDPGVLTANREAFLACLDQLAKSIGAKRIRGYSPRGGIYDDGSFELKMHIYEREV
jgi:hypothetical protein